MYDQANCATRQIVQKRSLMHGNDMYEDLSEYHDVNEDLLLFHDRPLSI